MQVKYKFFESSYQSWQKLFDQAASFASTIGPERLIGISHSHGGEEMGGTGVITVWYWDQQPTHKD